MRLSKDQLSKMGINPFSGKKSKFGNKITEVDGIKFDSKKEALRYSHLKFLLKAKQISDLKLQVRFSLDVNDVHIGSYIADFCYINTKGERVIEDVKGFKTSVYKIKKKLMKAIYDIEIFET